ncbi:four helix bundle protein [Roseibacillus ishigakijimensis]|uniref:Four helix bundle protein n=1 Tax=Roseibacillus ishigakijimensis TaxID=454146 RepID=A0A934RPW5_9BACT|nr:four helix bundle protein [Roseibacillus ishigakijimensis]MBK1833411.1 four helix bundle protein [Roseibacillus ishigakijimensis]
MSYQSFEDLAVWQRACRLAIQVYELMKDSRDFAYRDQMIRSSLSIPSNIAEGAERNSKKEFCRFLHIAKGSAAELRTQIYLCQKLSLLEGGDAQKAIQETKELSAMLQGLIKSLKT